jgi:predicted nucleic acid-binding protein
VTTRDGNHEAAVAILGIDTAFSFDRHFAQYGFNMLEAP